MDEARQKAIRAQLEEDKASVEQKLTEHGASPGGGVEVEVNEGFADSAQATAERSQLLSMIQQLQDQRAEIVAALGRIDHGTYGKCERCGREIEVERLEAIPTTRLCVSCKQERGRR